MNITESRGIDTRFLNFTPEEHGPSGLFDVDITLMNVLVNTDYSMIVEALNIRGPGTPVLLRVFVPPGGKFNTRLHHN